MTGNVAEKQIDGMPQVLKKKFIEYHLEKIWKGKQFGGKQMRHWMAKILFILN